MYHLAPWKDPQVGKLFSIEYTASIFPPAAGRPALKAAHALLGGESLAQPCCAAPAARPACRLTARAGRQCCDHKFVNTPQGGTLDIVSTLDYYIRVAKWPKR